MPDAGWQRSNDKLKNEVAVKLHWRHDSVCWLRQTQNALCQGVEKWHFVLFFCKFLLQFTNHLPLFSPAENFNREGLLEGDEIWGLLHPPPPPSLEGTERGENGVSPRGMEGEFSAQRQSYGKIMLLFHSAMLSATNNNELTTLGV